MNLRRLLPILTLVALLVAPFGRLAAAEAMMMPQQQGAMTMAGHCDEMPGPQPHRGDRTHKASIDCLIACAAMATAGIVSLGERVAVAFRPVGLAVPDFAGLHPEAEPPPPRRS